MKNETKFQASVSSILRINPGENISKCVRAQGVIMLLVSGKLLRTFGHVSLVLVTFHWF